MISIVASSIMNVLYKDVVLVLFLTVQVAMALLTQIQVLASFERVIEGNKICVLESAPIALAFAQPPFEDHQWILVLLNGVTDLILSQNSQVFEKDDVVAALQMSKEVGPPEDNPQAFYLGLAHFEHQVGFVLWLHVVLLLDVLLRKRNNLLDLFLGCVAVVVEVFLNQAVGVKVVGIFLVLQTSDQAV